MNLRPMFNRATIATMAIIAVTATSPTIRAEMPAQPSTPATRPAATSAAAPADGNSPARPVHKLPDNPAAVVITVDTVGGFGMPRKASDPQLLVRADGTASVRSHDPAKRTEWKMSAGQLQSLLGDLLDDLKFFEIKSPAGRKPQGLADAAQTIIRIRADGRSGEAKGYAMGTAGGDDNHKRFLLAVRRLERVQAVVTLGGEEQVALGLKAANDQIRKQFPKEKPLASTDLLRGSRFANGNTCAEFEREGLVVQAIRAKGKDAWTVTIRHD